MSFKNYRLYFAGLVVLGLMGQSVARAAPYDGSTFQDVWTVASEGPYEELPHYKVFLGTLS